MKEYTNPDPKFHESLSTIETTDHVHADVINEALTDIYDNTLFNKAAMDKADKAKGQASGTATLDSSGHVPDVQMDLGSRVVNFETATKRAGILPSDTMSEALGKLARLYDDLQKVAFSGDYKDLTGTPMTMKNPKSLKFTGGSTVNYDGSEEKSVAIPTSLPASGGNADTVGGKQASDLLNYANMSGIDKLTAQTSAADTDNLLIGTGSAKKITFANLVSSIIKKLTGGASSILTSNMTGSRVLISDSSGKVAVSSITSTILGYLSGLKSNVQSQIDELNSEYRKWRVFCKKTSVRIRSTIYGYI